MHAVPRLGLLLVIAMTGSCALEIARSHPRPNVRLAPASATLALEMASTVPARFTTGSPMAGVSSADVMAWRFTLQDAFHNGFGAAFSLAGPGERAALTIVLEEAALSFEATDVKNGKTIAAEAHVRYRAKLLGANGEVVEQAAGVAESKRSFTSLDQVAGVVGNAVEIMYEKLARELFASGTTPTPAP